MFKLIGLIALAAGCAPQIKEVRVEVQTPCLTQAPPAPVKLDPYEGPEPRRGVDAEGKELIGVYSIVSLESFNAFGQYVLKAQAWMNNAYSRCQVRK